MPCVKLLPNPSTATALGEHNNRIIHMCSRFRSWLVLQSCASIDKSTSSSPPLAVYSLARISRPCALASRQYLEPIQKATSAESLTGICVRNLGYMQARIYFVQLSYETPVEHVAALSASGALVTIGSYSVTIFILYCQECSTSLTLSIFKGPGLDHIRM